jgi:DegV family protein with EDD domain
MHNEMEKIVIKIISDSTCDLSQQIVDKYDIEIVPLTINIDGKIYKDRIDIEPNDFYSFLEELDKYPTTSMPSPTDFMKTMEKAVADGHDEILCICMSSGTSGSYQSAIIAKNDFLEDDRYKSIKVHVVDSKSMSHGSGWLILKSARLREKGATFEELVEFNEVYKKNVKHFLSIDDLGHLIKSGRLSNASAIIGKILKIQPIMTMKNGKGAIVAKVKGRKRVFKHYVSEFKLRVDMDLTDFIIIGYTSDEILAQNLKNTIINETSFKGEIFIMQMGVVVGNHVGLGAISMYFIEKGHRSDNLLINHVNDLINKKNELLTKIKKYERK